MLGPGLAMRYAPGSNDFIAQSLLKHAHVSRCGREYSAASFNSDKAEEENVLVYSILVYTRPY